MAAPNPLPQYIYKIVPAAPPSPLPAEYPLSGLDRNDGFIHLSHSKQIPKTAGRFFADATRLWLLRFELATLNPIRWEESVDAGEVFPHLYRNFGIQDVESVKEFERREGESWEEVLNGEDGWLV